MELKVLVDGEERCVQGINENTTCEQIIYALAAATAQKGKFVMVEKFRNMERRLLQDDKPLEMLKMWKEKASSVTFMLRRLNDNGTEEDVFRDKQNDFSSRSLLTSSRNPSSSSVASAQPASSRLSQNQNSTSSLPAYSASSHPQPRRDRPPPPDYKTVMEQKFASLSRGPQPRMPLKMEPLEGNSIASLGLSQNDLIALIEKQRQTLEKQKENLISTEIGLRSDEERELLQLQRQQENLRLILQPLREANWAQQYQMEMKKSQKLRAQIEATKEALDKTATDIDRLSVEERELLKQIESFQNENYDNDLHQMKILAMNDASQKLQAC